ncbi:MAG: histidine kinase [Campylobacterales bacterium]|nr:histidine kinase [Campylobacterales bacterium]
MHNIALHIKFSDWVYILFTGISFGMLLSSFGYTLYGYEIYDGAVFGFMLGFSITFFSLFFISNMNKNILPNIDERYWKIISATFSFLSGFLGTYSGVIFSRFFDVKLIEMFEQNLFFIANGIGVLTYIVGALLYRFVKMRNEKDYLDHQYLQSRLASLETQLNPHFLFNSLNSIAELIHQDPLKAEDAILKVSKFLRNTMKESAKLKLSEEIKNVKDYVELENIRFSNRIILDVEQNLPSWSVPKFSLQLLVENALKHGYDASKESLNIKIRFDEKNKTIQVQNDGKPIEKIRYGIGLTNLNQRLNLLCKGALSVDDLEKPLFTINLGDCYENTDS